MKKFSQLEEVQNEGIKTKLMGGLAALSMMISSCQSITPEEKARLKAEIEELNKQEEQGKEMSKFYDEQLENLRNEKSKLENEILESKKKLSILKSGRQPKYILKLKFQEHKMELSIDRIDFEFEVPVDEEFYNESEIGKELGEGSRSFSFGHSGDIKVIDKRIE